MTLAETLRKPDPPTTPFTLKLTPGEHATLKELAHTHRTSMSAIVRAMIHTGIANETQE